MKLTNLLNQPMQHCEDATAQLLRALKIRFTKTYLQKELTEHPNYPTLAAITDVIGITYGVSSVPVRFPISDYKKSPDFRLPFLAQIWSKETKHEVFAVVTQFSNNSIKLYNPASKSQEVHTVDAFNELYTGVLLITEAGKQTQEENYKDHLRKEKQRDFFNAAALLGLPVLTLIISCLYFLTGLTINAIAAVVYTLLILIGCIVSMFLVWHELDQYNPVVKQMCKTTAQVNCSAVLNSKASKIMGLSWSSLGLVYFTGILLSLLVTGLSVYSLVMASWVSAFALPYVIFSIYYQWKIIKQWCLLCLLAQGLLLLLFITGIEGNFYQLKLLEAVPLTSWLHLTAAFVFTFTGVIVLMPALQQAKNSRQKTIELQRLKHNTQIFEGLLARQKLIEKPADDLGITIGNPSGVLKLVKVCNPYCAPCAKAHSLIEDLVKDNEELSVQIIFTATENEKDKKKAPVMHLMSIAANGDEKLTNQALGDWYNAPLRDYQVFAEKYAAYTPPEQMNQQIKAMREWCDRVSITFTPSFFVCMDTHNNENGDAKFFQLPEPYSVADLKYFFTV